MPRNATNLELGRPLVVGRGCCPLLDGDSVAQGPDSDSRGGDLVHTRRRLNGGISEKV